MSARRFGHRCGGAGADRVKPESAPTLTEIARMLAQHPDFTLTIEGHTGDAEGRGTNRRVELVRGS